MAKYENCSEEEIKNKVAQDYFSKYEHTRIIGKIDFCITFKTKTEMPHSIMWAEAKQNIVRDINESFVQLILTIGKAKTFNAYIPPYFLGAFDAEKIAFISYRHIVKVFNQNDFNWNVAPSNHKSKEFLQLYDMVKNLLRENSFIFNFESQDKELKEFIKNNFKETQSIHKIQIDQNNFTFVYQKWLKEVKSTISVNWDLVKKAGILDADFFLADLLSSENTTIKEKLFVLLKQSYYELDRKIDDLTGLETSSRTEFNDKQKAHENFGRIYERPPKQEYWEFIVSRRDLLIPQDIRERKGSFFTPQIWVEKSQQYLAEVLGENWQKEYYIWDCAAGTGNLLNGLTNYRNIWASTLDKVDVDVMKDRIHHGWNMFKDHVFQFDFLNDDFTKCPQELQEIINNEEKRKKLVIYINPPYAEATSSKTISNKNSKHKAGISDSTIYRNYKEVLGKAVNELSVHFFIKIYFELRGCILGEFSTLKILQSQNFVNFRRHFKAKLTTLFLMPADSFDNVKGQFPIGFFIWDTNTISDFQSIKVKIFNHKGLFIKEKIIFSVPEHSVILNWIQKYYDKISARLAYMVRGASDFQNNNIVFITAKPSDAVINHSQTHDITQKNIIQNCIFFAVRHCIEATWINDRDQFLYPNDGWETDKEFQSDCLAYTLFHGQNRISCEQGINHWIPFTPNQVGCKQSFKSYFMSDFLNGKINTADESLLFTQSKKPEKIIFSYEAQAVYDAGLELWKYYHLQENANLNASFYDIRKHFQGINEKGRMNPKSENAEYMKLTGILREKMKILEKKIEPKVYEYGFLK